MKNIVVAMSGGVDSSVAAYLLKKAGHAVVGVTMQIWQQEDAEDVRDKGGCCGLTAVEDARYVCHQLGIPHYVLNFRDVFRTKVIDYFAAEYRAGRTPNPCIACNRYVKWQSFLAKVLELGGDIIATGHYSKIIQDAESGRFTIQTADSAKDQSYALYNLTQYQLKRTLFPIGHLPKDEVRRIAYEHIGMRVANKPDSQEICFIPDKNHPRFLAEYLGNTLPAGDFVDETGNVLGRHKGIDHYTIGQRKGLDISFGRPMYVNEIDAANNRVVLSNNDALFKRDLRAIDVNFLTINGIEGELRCFGKIRYSHKAAACTIKQSADSLECRFDEPQRAITPGQAAVFYDGEGRIICGGTIA